MGSRSFDLQAGLHRESGPRVEQPEPFARYRHRLPGPAPPVYGVEWFAARVADGGVSVLAGQRAPQHVDTARGIAGGDDDHAIAAAGFQLAGDRAHFIGRVLVGAWQQTDRAGRDSEPLEHKTAVGVLW